MESVVMFIDYMNSPLGLIEIKATLVGIAHVIFCGEDLKKEINSNTTTDACKLN